MALTSEYLNPRKIELYGILNSIISDKLIDINSTRVNNSDYRVKQWWFPEAPEKLDDNFPRGVINLGESSFEGVGADNYVDKSDTDGSEFYGQIERIPVTLSIFIKKDQFHKAFFSKDSVSHGVKNKKQVDYYAGLVPIIIKKYENLLNDRGFSIDGNITSGGAYEDGDFFWAIDISFTAETYAVWQESVAAGSIIEEYDLVENVELA